MSDEPSGRELDEALGKLLDIRINSDHTGLWIPKLSGADWQLVAERMRQDGWKTTITFETDDMGCEGCHYYVDINNGFMSVWDATPGAAVALAAYRALRAEEE